MDHDIEQLENDLILLAEAADVIAVQSWNEELFTLVMSNPLMLKEAPQLFAIPKLRARIAGDKNASTHVIEVLISG